MAVNATADLLAFAAAPHRLPEAIRGDALRLLGDTLAVGAAGTTAPGADGVFAAATRWGEGRDARPIGGGGRLPAAAAAFVNGFRIHCLEWDAVHEPAVVHALSVVTAALAAAIDRRGGCDADEALVALAVGVDVAAGLGLAATGPLRFFRPAVAGLVGAALAVARLERIDPAPVLGLAHAQCAGTMQAHVEGSIALPLQIGLAARAAITAVDLALVGLDGPRNALEGPFGHFALFDEGALATYTGDLGRIWRIGEVSVKPYPSGRASHGVLSALDLLRGEIAGRPVARIEARVTPLVARLVGRPWQADMTPAYARLCLPLLATLMLAGGRIDPRAMVVPEEVLVPLDLVPDMSDDPNALSPQHVVVHLADGTRLERAVPATLGSPAVPLSPAQAEAKRALARSLAREDADPRLFDDPLGYLTEPR